jgi:hypothetical protein
MQQDVPDNCKINFSRIPLDPRLKLEDITSVLYHHWNTTEYHRHLLLPDVQGVGLVKEQQNQDTHVHIYESGDIIGIDLDRDWEKVSISEKVSSMSIIMIIATSLTLMKTIVGSIHCSHQSSQQK